MAGEGITPPLEQAIAKLVDAHALIIAATGGSGRHALMLDTRIGRAAEELGALMPICSARASAEVVSAGA